MTTMIKNGMLTCCSAIANVLDFGASPSRSGNDSRAIQAANDYLRNTHGGGVIVIPRRASAYVLSSAVYIDSSVSVVGLGRPLLRLAPEAPIGLLSRPTLAKGSIATGGRELTVTSSVGIETGTALTIECAAGATTVQATSLVADISHSDTTIALRSVTGLGSVGTLIVGRTEIIKYTGIAGASLTGVTRGQLGTVAKAHAASTAVDACGVLFAQVESVSGRLVTLTQSATVGVNEAVVEFGASNISISGLSIDGNRNLADPPNANPHPILIRAGHNVTVERCTIFNGDHSAVLIDRGSINCCVRNCDIYNIGIPLAGLGSAIWLFGGVRNCTVEHNRIWGDTTHGITSDDRSQTADSYDGAPRNNTIANNTIDLSRSSQSAPDGIVFNGSIGCVVHGNSIRGKGGLSRGIVVGSGGQGLFPLANDANDVSHNIIEDCGLGALNNDSGRNWGHNTFRGCDVDLVRGHK